MEVHGNRWSILQLTTVAEEHPPDKQMLRCRLRTRPSLPGVVAFWILCGIELLMVGLLNERLGWWMLVLLGPPLGFVWFLLSEQRTLRSMIAVFLDEMAKEWKLTKVRVEPAPVAAPPPKPLPGSPFQETPKPELETSEKVR